MVYSRKHDMANRRKKVAKIEQVNLFTKVAAPSGLLEELNPGILNRPRNSKQVYSIIEALVRGEKLENTQSMQQSRFKKEIRDNDVNERSNTLSGGNQVGGNLICPTRPLHINSEHKGEVVCDLSVAVRKGEDHGDDKHEVMSENAESDYETVSTENTRTYWLPSGVGASSKWGPEIFADPGERLKGLVPSSYIEELSQEPYPLLLEQCQVQALQLLACVSGCGTAYSRLVGDYDRLLDLNSCLEQRIPELEENMGQEHGPCRKYVGELEKKIVARDKQLKSLKNSVSLADLETVKGPTWGAKAESRGRRFGDPTSC